jgi:hypothetical protein
MSYCGGNGHRRDLRSEVEDDLVLTSGTHQSVTERGLSGYRFGIRLLGRGLLPLLGRKVFPPRPFSIFFFFSLFSFSVFLFFHIICKFDSNQAKPI